MVDTSCTECVPLMEEVKKLKSKVKKSMNLIGEQRSMEQQELTILGCEYRGKSEKIEMQRVKECG